MPRTIGQIANRIGLTARAIRHYEKLGLLSPPRRSPSNYRIYGPDDIDRLSFIANCRALGFSIPEIAELLRIMDDPNHTCAQVAALADRHLRQVDAKLQALLDARDRVAHVLANCSGTDDPDCPMLDDLGSARSLQARPTHAHHNRRTGPMLRRSSSPGRAAPAPRR